MAVATKSGGQIRQLVNIFSSSNMMLGEHLQVVWWWTMCLNPQSTEKWAQGCSVHLFYREFWWGMHAQSCHCPLLGSCQWWPWGLPFACTTHWIKTVTSVAKLRGAWWPSPGNKGAEYSRAQNTMTYIKACQRCQRLHYAPLYGEYTLY